ncbi:nuclear pore complex protein NUP93B-like isoform X2 [Glycine soja]|uniref:nuclear pore complex protein NUP93B-like isoform X2 n=1 Tax=Glycine soja TaxID=3848 RepID=UPI00103E00DF|nr:nuclear pore complex protein NUP93B-like isoform X2 [Glycine soja]XP_040866018.1 nuclear pore complex protein NUP93B-like isoform X2 [Glycine max]
MPSMEIVPLTGRPIAEKKASVYAEAALGVGVGNLQRIRAFLWIRLRDYGVLDFDAGNARRLPLVDTTWQQSGLIKEGWYLKRLQLPQQRNVKEC